LPSCANVIAPESLRPENLPKRNKAELILAIAAGIAVADWARQNKVPRRTAFRWAGEPKVRARVEAQRRRALDRAVGKMSDNVFSAVEGIVELGKNAASESVKLAALRSVLSDLMAVSKFGCLEDRMTQIEEQLNERTGNTGGPG
jgi:hypothetical protein